MTRVQGYLREKKIQELGLPKLYVVESSRKGVKLPVERQVIEIIKGKKGIRLPINNLVIDRYKLDNVKYPYDVYIVEGETSSEDSGYGTGIGDLWSWTYFSFFSKEDADKYYQKESDRVKNEYLLNNEEQNDA